MRTQSRLLLVSSICLMVLFAYFGHARETSHTGAASHALHLKSFPTERQVNYLSIHPDTHIVAYTFIGREPGGFKAIDDTSGSEIDTLPTHSRPPDYVHMKLSPSGKQLAFVQTEKGESTLKIGALDGSNATVCAKSSAYYRPLAFSFDEQLLVALSADGDNYELVLCSTAGGMIRTWAVTTLQERMKELFTLRFHGSPSWMIDTASVSVDGNQILSVRSDGQIVLWDLTGRRLRESTLEYFSPGTSDRRVAFAEDGTVLTFTQTTTDQGGRTPLIVWTLFPEQKYVFEVLREARVPASPGMERAFLHATRQGLYLLYLTPSGVAIVRARNGETIAEVPVTAPVTALSMSQDGTTLGVAQHGSIELWQLAQDQ